jgi:protoporphyrinogen oxidase
VASGVDRIAVESGRVVGIEGPEGAVEADAVVFAGTLPGLTRLVPAELADPRWAAIGGLGAMCVVLELRRKVTDCYWLNICDTALPLTAFIEHTNFVPASDYGGRHLAYLGRYFTDDDPLATVDVEEESRRWVELLAESMPGFRAEDVVGLHPARTPYAAPLITLGHMRRMPPVASHIPGLYVCTTAQVYPQDRGMSEGVRLGTEAADALLAGAGSPLPILPR